MQGRELHRASLAAAALSGFGMLFSTGPVVFATFSLFMLPLAETFGWGRGQISAALVISALGAALADPLVGRLVDRWGVRRVLLPGMFAFAAANAALSSIDGSILGFYGIFALLGVSSALCAAVPYSKVVAGWFSARRGLVLGVSLGIGAGVGSAVVPQIARVLIDEFGWRAARVGLGALVAGVGAPVIWLFLRENCGSQPAEGVSPDSLAETGRSGREARRDPTFWTMFVMLFVGTTALAGTVIHLVAMLRDRGLPTVTATAIFSGYAVANIMGHVLVGFAQDRIDSPKVGLVVYACALLGLLLLSNGSDIATLGLGAVVLGLGFGAEVSLGAYWVARYWGMRSYGEIYGLLYCAASAGVAVGPLLMGVTFDTAGSYGPLMASFQVALALCFGLNLTLRPYRFESGPRRPDRPPATRRRRLPL